MNSKSFSILVLLLALVPSVIVHGSMVKVDIDTMWEESDLVVLGNVTSIETQIVDKGMIYRIVTIQVETYYIQTLNQSTVKVRIEGGDIGGTGVWVEDQPEFSVDERVFVFLKEDSNVAGGYGYTVYAWYQGKFTVEGLTAKRSDGESFTLPEADPIYEIGVLASPAKNLNSTILPMSILILLGVLVIAWSFYRKSH